jgi:hypothetical protein
MGEANMNTSTVFLAAFWSGLGAPAALFAPTPAFRPAIADLTPVYAFALVGTILNRAFSETVNEQFAAAAEPAAEQQLSLEFPES